MAAGALGQTSKIIKSIVFLIEKTQQGLKFLQKSGVVRSIHLVSSVLAGLALFLNLLKQTLFVFYLTKEQRSEWWNNKKFGGKAAYIAKCFVAVAGIGLAIASIVTSGLTALILVASCYVASSVQNFISFFRKLPKIIDKIKSATQERENLIEDIKNNGFSDTKALDLNVKKNEINQLRLDAVSQVGNFAFNGVYVAAAVLLVVAPPVGAIMLGITVLANIGFAAVTGVIGKIFSKKAAALDTQKKELAVENNDEPKDELKTENENIDKHELSNDNEQNLNSSDKNNKKFTLPQKIIIPNIEHQQPKNHTTSQSVPIINHMPLNGTTENQSFSYRNMLKNENLMKIDNNNMPKNSEKSTNWSDEEEDTKKRTIDNDKKTNNKEIEASSPENNFNNDNDSNNCYIKISN